MRGTLLTNRKLPIGREGISKGKGRVTGKGKGTGKSKGKMS